MGNVVTAVDYFHAPEKVPLAPVIILFGEEQFLRAEVFKSLRDRILGGEDAEFSLTTYEGGNLRFSDLVSELSTRSLFGDSPRLVRITEGDSFVSENGEKLEDYLDAPSESGILLLQLKTCASNTRLYKKASQNGLLIDCRPPEQGAIALWLREWGITRHHLAITQEVASLLIDLLGTETGILDQELARLALLLPEGEKLTASFVSDHVGSWRLRKVWDLVDALLAGNIPEGFRQLDLLLAAGETPIGILAQMSPTLRKLGLATHYFLDVARSGRRVTPHDAVLVAKFPPFVAKKAEDQMKRLGRVRGEKILSLLLQADLDMKGASRLDPRLILEKLMIELASPALR